jgi:hypothetical protein
MKLPDSRSEELTPHNSSDRWQPVVTLWTTTFLKVLLIFCACVMSLAPISAQSSVDKAWSTLESGVTEKGADNRATAVRILGLIERLKGREA